MKKSGSKKRQSTGSPLLGDAGLASLSKLPASVILRSWRTLLVEVQTDVRRIAATAPPTWESFIIPLMMIDDRLERAWGRVGHLSGVMDAPARRRVVKQGEAWLSAYSSWYSQHRVLARKTKVVADKRNLSLMQRRVLSRSMRVFLMGGAYSPPTTQRRIRQLKLKLTKLSTAFSERLLDSTAAGFVAARQAREVRGIPAPVVAAARQRAQQRKQTGWVFGLQGPEYLSVMQTAEDRGLRQRMYRAAVTRASEFGPAKHDNTPIVADILRTRQALARILGFPTFAHVSLDKKMATTPERALRFLRRMVVPARRQAKQEFARLKTFSARKLKLVRFQAWDMEFASEQLRHAAFGLNQEALRPYFPMSAVMAELWRTAERVLAMKVRRAPTFRGYRPDLQAYDLLDRSGQPRGRIIFDHYVRPEKRQGYWQHTDTSRSMIGAARQLPVAYIVGNFPQPDKRGESYLNHREVETLFHELGHALHTVLTDVPLPDVAGTNGVEWDAVELPSQWFEQFAWEPTVMQAIARRAGKRLSPSQLKALHRSRTFHGGLWLNRQLLLGLFDLTMHSVRHPTKQTAQQTWLKVFKQVSVVPRISQSRLANSFSHLFDGAYAAGYYSYLWAEVLAADAYALFAGRPGEWAKQGRKFRQEILAVGGSKPPAEAYRAFRGRDARPTALYRRYGLPAA